MTTRPFQVGILPLARATRAQGVALLERAKRGGGAVLARFDGGRLVGYEVVMAPRPRETRACTCGATMRARAASRTGDLFWGCATFPRCRQLVPIYVECTLVYPKELPW